MRVDFHQMPAQGIIGITAAIIGGLCGLVGSLVHIAMTEKVNARLPKGQQFSYVGRNKVLKVGREYRRLYSDGKLHIVARTLAAAALACALCILWAVGFVG